MRVTALPLAATLLPRQRKRTARRPLLCLAASLHPQMEMFTLPIFTFQSVNQPATSTRTAVCPGPIFCALGTALRPRGLCELKNGWPCNRCRKQQWCPVSSPSPARGSARTRTRIPASSRLALLPCRPACKRRCHRCLRSVDPPLLLPPPSPLLQCHHHQNQRQWSDSQAVQPYKTPAEEASAGNLAAARRFAEGSGRASRPLLRVHSRSQRFWR